MRKIYKYFVKIIFKLFYPKIKIGSIQQSNNFLFNKFKIKNVKIKIYKIKKCRLFTNTLDVAVIKNNILLNGPSLQIRNNINANIKENIAAHSGTPKFFKAIPNRVFSLLAGLDSNNNYFHWFFDSISKIYFYKKYFKFNKNDFFLVPDSKKNYQKESLKLFGIKNILNANDVKYFKFKELITTNFTNFNDNPPLEIINFIRNSFLKKNYYKNIKINKIFLDRSYPENLHRDIYNKKEIIFFLKKNKFKILNLSKHTFFSQIIHFANAKIILGMHGASFTNIIFCNKKAKIIELKSIGSRNNLYKNIAKKLNLNFKDLYFRKEKKNVSSRPWDGHIYINIKKLIKFIK